MASQPLQSTSANQPLSGGRTWMIRDLREVVNLLHPVAHKCIDFGIQLGVEDDKMQAIEEEHTNPSKRLREILRHRLRQAPLTVHDIVQALRSNVVQEMQLASEIESQYRHVRQTSASASTHVAYAHTLAAPPPSTHLSVSQSMLLPNFSTPITQSQPPLQPAPHVVHVHADNTLSQSQQPLHPQPQYPSLHPPPNSLAATPSQPQAEATQPLSSSQPSSSQLISQHIHQSSVSTSPKVTCMQAHPDPPPIHHSASQAVIQPDLPTHNAQPPTHFKRNQPALNIPVPVDRISSHPQQLAFPQQSHLQYSLPNSFTNTSTSTTGCAQTSTPQLSSLLSPFPSQFMSMMSIFQAMTGTQLLPPSLPFQNANQFLCNSQLSQDVATPHHLQVGEQQTLQGQPPLQHIPSHEPQTVAQSHGTGPGSSPPQTQGVCVESQSMLQPSIPIFNTHLHPHLGPRPLTPGHVGSMPSQPPQPLHFQSYPSQYVSPHPPPNHPTFTPSQPQAGTTQPPSSSQPSSSQLMSVPVTSQAMPGPSPQLSQDVATPHHLQVGEQQALQGQPPLQHIPSHEPQKVAQSHGTGPDSGPPQYCGSPMAQYINYVKTTYRKSVVEKKYLSIKWPPTPSTVYINLVCVDRTADLPKEEADECTRAMVCDGSVDVILKKKTPIDFSDIARDVPDSETLILVEGAPGVGKSTFSWEFCRRWERGEVAQQYQLVLLLRLRDERMSRAQSLADLIYHPSHDIRQAVVQELGSTLGVSTLIILEGFDELPSACRTQSSLFFQLANGELLPNATVLVTSRPWATQRIHMECRDHIFQHIEILGFTSDQIEEYVTSVFMGKKKAASDMDREDIKEVMSYIGRYPQIRACMYIPLNSAIVVSVYQESKAGKYVLPKTLTELYCALIQTLLLRYLYGHPEYGKRKWKIKSFKEDLPQDVYSQLLTISELAYSGICTDQGDNVRLIFSNLPSDFKTLGLMQSVPQLYVTQGEDTSHNFLHLTVQEFLAALHISNMSSEKQIKHFQRQGKNVGEEWMPEYFQRQEEGRWRVVLRFLAGITKLANFSPDILRGLLLRKPNGHGTELAHTFLPLPMIKSQTANGDRYNMTAGVELNIQHVHWMFEAQRQDILSLVLQEKTTEFICHKWFTPLDYYSLGYCIVHSHSQWVLTVEAIIRECVIGLEEVRMLVAGARTRQDTTAKVVGLGSDRMGMSLHERRLVAVGDYESGDYEPLYVSAEALNVLFVELKNMIHLQELHLNLPAQCSSIAWPNLSELRVLHLAITGEKDWKLGTLLPQLSLDSLTIEVTGGLGLDNAASIGDLFLSSKCPQNVCIIDKQSFVTAEVAVGQHVHEKQLNNTTSSVEEQKSFEFVRCCLDWYSLGCVIAHSNCQWVLTVEEERWKRKVRDKEEVMCKEVIGEEAVRLLVAGANTKRDTSASVVGLKSSMFGQYKPLFISAEALNVLLLELKSMIHLHELYLNLPAQCSSILWPNLSGIRVLHIGMKEEGNWRLDALLPRLSLESLTVESTKPGGTVALEDYMAIGMLLSSSKCLKCFQIYCVSIAPQGMQLITKAMSDNQSLPLRSLVVQGCTFSGTAAQPLALFITNSTTLHHLSIVTCKISAHGLLELAQAIHHSSSLQKRQLEWLTCIVDGDDEASTFAQLLVDYPLVVRWLGWDWNDGPLQCSHISDKGAQSIATALHHNSTLRGLERLALSNKQYW